MTVLTEEERKAKKKARRRERRKTHLGKHALRPRAPGFSKALKRQIRARDGHQCVICKTGENLRIHHLNENHDDHRWENLITVCVSCHLKVHRDGLVIPEKELEKIR
jgi:hypothetical protein